MGFFPAKLSVLLPHHKNAEWQVAFVFYEDTHASFALVIHAQLISSKRGITSKKSSNSLLPSLLLTCGVKTAI